MTAFSLLTAPPAIRDFSTTPGLFCRQPRGANKNFFALALVAQREGSDLAEHPDPTDPRTDLIVLGVFKANAVFTSGTTVDSSGGALDANGNPQSLSIETGTIGWFDTGTSTHQITHAMVGTVCYLYDNNTLYADDNNGTLSSAGFVAQVRADGKVKLRIDPAVYLLGRATNAEAQSPPFTARAVATSIGANTGTTTGKLTITATGALGAQDGLTLVAGDVIFIPEGTTNLAAASDAGPYEVLNAGATGVQAVLQRPSWWAKGGPIPLGAEIKIGGGGTKYADSMWYAGAIKGKVIDTDDAVFWPRKLTRDVTLASGTLSAAITDMPVKSATRSGILITSMPTTVPHANTRVWRVSALTAGVIGTASIQMVAESAPGTTNASDVGTYTITVEN